MKFKALLLVCTILSTANTMQADSKLAQVLTFIKENPGKTVQATAGGLSFAAGTLFTVVAIGAMYTTRKDRNLGSLGILSCTLSVAYSGLHTMNDVLNNKPKEALIGLIQNTKAQLQKSKINEQK